MEKKDGMVVLHVAFFPEIIGGSGKREFKSEARLKIGVHTPNGITTINEYSGKEAIGLFQTLANPKLQNVVNFKGGK